MRKNTLISIVLAVALCALTTSAGMIGLGGVAAKKPIVLSGLSGVYVKVIVQNSKELEEYSSIVTQQQLRTKVESILRRRNISVFSEDEAHSVPGKPVLEVAVFSAIDKQLGMMAISVRMKLIEDISLARNANLKTRAAIWARLSTILANFEEVETVGKVVGGQINSFCDLYDAANPRPQ